jgi:hypothetical protein
MYGRYGKEGYSRLNFGRFVSLIHRELIYNGNFGRLNAVRGLGPTILNTDLTISITFDGLKIISFSKQTIAWISFSKNIITPLKK